MSELITSNPAQKISHKCVVYLVEEQANPSTDYFVLPAIYAEGCNVVRCNFVDLPAPKNLDGAVLVFVRYIPSAWMKLVEAVRPRLRSLVFFMDDDVLDVNASVGMPLRYRIKLARLAAWRFDWLRAQDSELWLSTPYLHGKYAEWKPRLLLPFPLTAPTDVCRVFYHGSASHDAEISWLHQVMEKALSREERLSFEIVGGSDVYRLYRGLPRVNVVHPMKWPAYQHFLSMQGRHIGLAPLLDSAFNKARSHTKFFDFTRCGAVGIFSQNGPYAEVVKHGVDGLVLALDQHAWVTAILDLARDEALRNTLLHNAEIKSAELAGIARQGSAGLFVDPPRK